MHTRRLFAASLAAVSLGVAGIGVARSGLLGVSSIEVEGATRLPVAAIRSAAGIELGDNSLLLDLEAAAAGVAALEGVADAEVLRAGSLGVRIVVEEVQAAYRVPGAPTRYFAADGSAVPAPRGAGRLPSLSGKEPDAGTREALLATWRLLRPAERRSAAFEATPRGLVVELGPTMVVLGDGSQISLKVETLRRVTASLRAGDRLRRIDLSDPMRPTVRMTDAN